VVIFRIPASDEDNEGFVAITNDLKDDNIDIAKHPVANLEDTEPDAHEVIWVKGNGWHGFALFNGQGELQEEVPFDIANDSTIPSGYTQRLQNGISCVRCHAADDGWRMCRNDVKTILHQEDGNPPLDVFDKDNVRLFKQYGGDLERKLFPRGRDDYNSTVLKVCGPLKASGKLQLGTVKAVSDRVASEYAEYDYVDLGYKQLLADVGEKDRTRARFDALVPPVNVVTDGVVPEDFRVAGIRKDVGIGRPDYDLAFSFLARRVQVSRLKEAAAKEKRP
jgi:hypothetical protein